MSGQEDPTMLISNGRTWKTLIKGAMASVGVAIGIILAIWQTSAFMIRENGVTAEKVEQIEAQQKEFVRKEALEPRLKALEDNIGMVRQDQKEIRDELKENGRLLNQILLEQRRR